MGKQTFRNHPKAAHASLFSSLSPTLAFFCSAQNLTDHTKVGFWSTKFINLP